jgi:collagenase-like PrtC family protease
MTTKSEIYEKGLKIPYNWDISLFAKLARLNGDSRTRYPVVEVYAADKYSMLGSGRTASTTFERELPIAAHIAEAHRHGIRFEYLWNAITVGGKEWDRQFQDKLHEEARELVEAGVDGFTVSNLLLCRKLRSWFPDLQISSSVNNHLDSVERIAQWFQYTSVDRIMLDNRSSRNFGLIRKIHAEFPQHPIIVLANEACLPECVMQSYHQEHTANASRCGSGYNAPDLCRIFCTVNKLKNPAYTLKAPWLRPEDIHYLFESGASIIKLAGRTESTEWIVRLAEAYAFGRYDGDIWELIEKPGSVRPEWESVLKKKLEKCRFIVDNSKLDGFIEPFVKGTVPCVMNGHGCGTCKWCENWMGAVSSPGNVEERLQDLEKILDEALG